MFLHNIDFIISHDSIRTRKFSSLGEINRCLLIKNVLKETETLYILTGIRNNHVCTFGIRRSLKKSIEILIPILPKILNHASISAEIYSI